MDTNAWVGRTWELDTVSEALSGLRTSTGTNQFRLRAVEKGDQIVALQTEFDGDDMADCWKNCVFVARGDTPVPSLETPLDADADDDELLRAVADIQVAIHSQRETIERLEGEFILPEDSLHGSLTLMQVPGALPEDEPLLVVSFVSDGDGNTGGTGAGHGRRP